jgi:hypothetical protein
VDQVLRRHSHPVDFLIEESVSLRLTIDRARNASARDSFTWCSRGLEEHHGATARGRLQKTRVCGRCAHPTGTGESSQVESMPDHCDFLSADEEFGAGCSGRRFHGKM